MWRFIISIADIPADRDVRLAIIESGEIRALAFPCRHRGGAWIEARTGRLIEVYPSHCEEWLPHSQ